jgi:hypothetical protein
MTAVKFSARAWLDRLNEYLEQAMKFAEFDPQPPHEEVPFTDWDDFDGSQTGATTAARRQRGSLFDENFNWPSTDAPIGNGSIGGLRCEPEGLLSRMGYRVGQSYGLPEGERRSILDRIYNQEVPQVISEEYMDEWGSPETGIRLKKIAECIAAFARNMKRRRSTSHVAIQEWEADLQYLKWTYYDGRYDFSWPLTDN